jgi:MFS family permease
VTARRRTFASLAEHNYRLYAAGALISNVGTWMMNTAMAWLVLLLTGDGLAVGLTVALQLLPTVLLSAHAGVLADRFAKDALLRVMQVVMAVPAAVLGILAVLDAVDPWQVHLLAFASGVGRALEAPARHTIVPELVGHERLGNAVALNSASFNAGRLLGPAAAGALIAAWGAGTRATGWVMLLNAASFGASWLALARLDRDRLQRTAPLGHHRGAVAEGLRYVRSRPDLQVVLLCVFFVGGFGMNFQITSALMAQVEFGRGAEAFGLLGSLLAVGSLAGALLVAGRRGDARLRHIVLAGLVLAVLTVASGLMPTFATYAAVLPFTGAAFLTAGTLASAAVQLRSAPALRGRVAALYLMVFVGAVPLVAPVVGWVGDAFGPRAAVVLSGLVAGAGVVGAVVRYAMVSARVAPR